MSQKNTSNTLHIHVFSSNILRVSNFNLFHTMASLFDLQAFEASSPNDPKMTLNTSRSKILHILSTCTPRSQISLVSLYKQSFPRYLHVWLYLIFPAELMLWHGHPSFIKSIFPEAGQFGGKVLYPPTLLVLQFPGSFQGHSVSPKNSWKG